MGGVSLYLYKGKGVALERGIYRGLKLLGQVMKVLERVAKNFLRQQVSIADIRCIVCKQGQIYDLLDVWCHHQRPGQLTRSPRERYSPAADSNGMAM